MPKKSDFFPKTLEQCLAEMVQNVGKAQFSFIRRIFQENKKLDNLFEKNPEERKKWLKKNTIFLKNSRKYVLKKHLKGELPESAKKRRNVFK